MLPLALVFGIGAWLWKEGVTVQYAASIALARLHLIQLSEPEMVEIPGGTFQRGDVHGIGTKEEQPVRKVILRPFKIGKYETTFEEYDRYVVLTGRQRPSNRGRGLERHPVINVSWNDAVAYAKWLSHATGKFYRLPTEVEWEYAARSGGKDDIWSGTSNEEHLAEYAVVGLTEPVGSRKPNGLGLHDMSGNVWEWVEDCWHINYDGAPTDGSGWLEVNGGDCAQRVLRGGSGGDRPLSLRSSHRFSYNADFRIFAIGFRLAQDIP